MFELYLRFVFNGVSLFAESLLFPTVIENELVEKKTFSSMKPISVTYLIYEPRILTHCYLKVQLCLNVSSLG